MMMVVLYVAAIVALFGLTILVHEGGHFLVARALGMVADTFSIGMGPALWKKKIGATVYKIGLLPIGGYVALPQMDPNSFLEGDSGGGDEEAVDLTPRRELPRVAPWKKMLVAVAGATGNVVFAFVLATVVWAVGKPASPQEQNSVIGYVEAEGAAAAAGVQVGDRVVHVQGKAVENWVQISETVALSPEATIRVGIQSAGGGAEREVELTAEDSGLGFRVLPELDGMTPCQVASVFPNSGAAAAGLKPGDVLTALNGVRAYSRAHLVQMVTANGVAEAEVEFRRGGERMTARIRPMFDEEEQRPLLGVAFNTLSDMDETMRTHPTPWAQVKGHASSLFLFLRALVTPASSKAAAGSVGGPVMIFVMFWLMIKSSFVLAVWFTAFLNVNLAVINLLPLPVLDGGHILFNLWEWVTHRPIPARVVNVLANLFAVLFVLLFLYLTFRDVMRNRGVWSSMRMDDPAETVDTPGVFAPEAKEP